jgi:hypothetical protein
MASQLLRAFREILNIDAAAGARHVDAGHAPIEDMQHGQEKGQGRQVLTPEAAIRGMDSRRLPRDYDEMWG